MFRGISNDSDSSYGLTNDGITEVSITKTYPEIAGKKVTLSYKAATANDEAVVTRYGGLLQTPAYLISVKPEIRLDEAVILSGPVMGLGRALTLMTEIASPNMPLQRKDADITRGISYAIGIPALHYSGLQLVGQIDRMRVLEGTLHDSTNAMDARAGELLHNIAIEYFGQLNNTSRSIEGIMHVQNTKMPSIALVSADATYEYTFGVPISAPIMQGLGIDAIRIASSPMPIDGDLNHRREFIKHRGLTSSYLEHKILENLLQAESISAVKALQIAAKNGIPLHTINRTNIDSILPVLTISGRDKMDIRNAVNAGKEVIVSRDNITLGDWTGIGYIARDPNTGSGVYMISNELGGGGTVKASNPKFDEEQKIAMFVVGEPASPIDYLAYWWMVDKVLQIFIMPLWTYFGYTPDIIGGITDKQLLLQAANHPYTWIFYYMGHGGYDPEDESGNVIWEQDYLLPKKNEEIFPTMIKTDAKMVFLNGCGAGHYGNFANSFRIDGEHRDESRDEVFMSWRGKHVAGMASDYGLQFWSYMGMRKIVAGETKFMTVGEAIELLRTTYAFFPFDVTDLNTIGNQSTTLVP